MSITTTAKSPIRRRVRKDWRNGDLVGYKTKSFTKDDGTEYHPVIDVSTGEFSCTCPDHVYRHRACKHIQRMAAQLKAELAPSGSHCCSCKSEEQLLPLANDDGSPREGFLCRTCAQERFAQFERSEVR